MNPSAPTDAQAQRARKLFEEANGLVAQAKKSQESKGKFWGSVFGKGNDDSDELLGLYKRAGRLYSEAELYEEAGKAYEDGATARETDKSGKIINDDLVQKDAARVRVDAFNAYKRAGNVGAAMRCMNLALEVYRILDDPKPFADAAEKAAALLEAKEDRRGALALYGEMAKRMDDNGNWGAHAAKWYDKAADLSSLEGDYYIAVASYERAADLYLNGKYRNDAAARKIWFKAGLCALATKDLVTAQRNVQTYREADPGFGNQRGCQLLVDLIEAIGAGDQEAFTQKLHVYDQMTPLTPWEAAILVKIKGQIEEPDNEFA